MEYIYGVYLPTDFKCFSYLCSLPFCGHSLSLLVAPLNGSTTLEMISESNAHRRIFPFKFMRSNAGVDYKRINLLPSAGVC